MQYARKCIFVYQSLRNVVRHWGLLRRRALILVEPDLIIPDSKLQKRKDIFSPNNRNVNDVYYLLVSYRNNWPVHLVRLTERMQYWPNVSTCSVWSVSRLVMRPDRESAPNVTQALEQTTITDSTWLNDTWILDSSLSYRMMHEIENGIGDVFPMYRS